MMEDDGKSRKDELTLVFEEQYKKLFGMVYRMTENVQATEDVLQNVFLNAYKNVKNFKGDSKISTWLYRITVNECYGYILREFRIILNSINTSKMLPKPSGLGQHFLLIL